MVLVVCQLLLCFIACFCYIRLYVRGALVQLTLAEQPERASSSLGSSWKHQRAATSNRWNRKPRPQPEPQMTSLDKYKVSQSNTNFLKFLGLGLGVSSNTTSSNTTSLNSRLIRIPSVRPPGPALGSPPGSRPRRTPAACRPPPSRPRSSWGLSICLYIYIYIYIYRERER